MPGALRVLDPAAQEVGVLRIYKDAAEKGTPVSEQAGSPPGVPRPGYPYPAILLKEFGLA